ncbi:claudin-19 [Kryptolebias marmoratus]|uniref:Claudin-19-like n=1 Tax=Kryptolebias marmoratus TaxID=37003 RepID=A0A3Q3BIC1_KRYMA|nr:claudin-19 [Kryptolebias marmoratus]
MASSAVQIVGFLLSLAGVSATIAATFKVEWRKEAQGKHRTYEGLWMSCSGTERTTCEWHLSVMKLPIEVQATRAVMVVSLFLSAVALIVSTVGMKCTHFMDNMPETKSKVAVTGGVLFVLSGLLTIIITSWYVSKIVETYNSSHRLQSREFGNAVFISLGGGFLTAVGGAFLSCQTCCRNRSSTSKISNHLLSTTNPKSNYV